MTSEQIARLRAAIDELGRTQITFTLWDPYILGDADELATEVMAARQAAQRELEPWRAGRFDSVQLSVTDALFSKQQDCRSAARIAIRPFAAAFRSIALSGFWRLEPGEVFRRPFKREPSPGKGRAHLSPEGRVQTICEVSRLLLEGLEAGVQTFRRSKTLARPSPPHRPIPTSRGASSASSASGRRCSRTSGWTSASSPPSQTFT